MSLHYSSANITIGDRWSINGKMRFWTLLTVKGWSSTLPTATAALSSNVFVAPVSTWWSFILFSLRSPFILWLTTINSEVLYPVGRHICLNLLETDGSLRFIYDISIEDGHFHWSCVRGRGCRFRYFESAANSFKLHHGGRGRWRIFSAFRRYPLKPTGKKGHVW